MGFDNLSSCPKVNVSLAWKSKKVAMEPWSCSAYVYLAPFCQVNVRVSQLHSAKPYKSSLTRSMGYQWSIDTCIVIVVIEYWLRAKGGR